MWYNQYLKNENNFLSTNPTALILSTPVSEFWTKNPNLGEKNFGRVGGGGGGGGGWSRMVPAE